MKILYVLILFAATSCLQPLAGQNSNPVRDVPEEVAAAIRSGNSRELSKFFNSSIDLMVPGTDGTFSKVQAEQIMKDFFAKNPPKSFKINHQGSSNDGSLFSIGTFSAASKSFRTYFLIKKSGNSSLIQQLQFEENQ